METTPLDLLLFRLPLLLVLSAGIAVSLKQRRALPGVSHPMLLALSLLGAVLLVDSLVSPGLPGFAQAQGWGPQGFGLLMTGKGFLLGGLVMALAWWLALRATLAGRDVPGGPDED